MEKFSKNIKILLVSTAIIGTGSCASQNRRLKMGDIGKMSLSDIVHPKILETLGVDKKELPPVRRDEPLLEQIYYEFKAHAELYDRPIPPDSEERLRVMTYVDQLSRTKEKGVVATCNRYFLNTRTLDGGVQKKLWTEIEVHRAGAESFATESASTGQNPDAGETAADGIGEQSDPGQQEENFNDLKFKMLVYHELFHCLYNRGHLREGYGIMAATLLKSDVMNPDKWEAYVANMFQSQFDLTDPIPN